ncbi:MAG: CbtA family protein [Mycobacterium sp.]
MNARAFLVRGLLAGLLAGFATFAVAFVIGEPYVDRAIAIEESTAAGTDHHVDADGAALPHSHDHETAVVSRQDQSTWGLATGTVTIGVTVGGVLGLVAASVMGRVGRLSPGTSTVVVGVVGYVSAVLVPFVKYPATPPAVGSGETIGQRTALYFTFLLISVAAAVVCSIIAAKVLDTRGVQGAVLTGAGVYLAVVVAAGALMPTVDEIGDFPADVLWDFRLASVITLTALWAMTTIVLTALIRRLHAEQSKVQARRHFAASL